MEAAARDFTKTLSGSSNSESLSFFLNLYFQGSEPFSDQPLILIENQEIKRLFNFPLNQKLFSYNQIVDKLDSPSLIIPLAAKAWKEKSSISKKGKIELSSIKPGFWVAEIKGELKVIASPFKTLPKGTLIDLKKALSTQGYQSFANLQKQLFLFKNLEILAYPAKDFKPLKSLTLPPDDLSNALESLYSPLEKTHYLKTANGFKYYPSFFQLKLERWMTLLPTISIVLCLYFIALVFYRFPLLFTLAFALHTALLVFRSWILQRPPVSNMAETVLYVPWVGALAALISQNKAWRIAASLAVIVLLTLLEWSGIGSSLDTVQPVLDSKFWLTVHVLMVVGSYAFFLLAGLLAHFELFSTHKFSKAIRLNLYLGLSLLIPGTILGGVWAAESWGRFWDWDPKESWAFISSAIYLIVVHLDRFGKIGPTGLAIGALIGLQAITFTWYGVNYILGVGLHSYGFGSGGELLYLSFATIEFAIIGYKLITESRKTKFS